MEAGGSLPHSQEPSDCLLGYEMHNRMEDDNP
jgi:hypothetical protein